MSISPQAERKTGREADAVDKQSTERTLDQMATAAESKMHRLRVGDKVAWQDESEFPPIQYEGEVKGFDNEEMTYLQVEGKKIGSEGETEGKAVEKVLTEDEVSRIG